MLAAMAARIRSEARVQARAVVLRHGPRGAPSFADDLRRDLEVAVGLQPGQDDSELLGMLAQELEHNVSERGQVRLGRWGILHHTVDGVTLRALPLPIDAWADGQPDASAEDFDLGLGDAKS